MYQKFESSEEAKRFARIGARNSKPGNLRKIWKSPCGTFYAASPVAFCCPF